jgi:hypothetical protein
MSTQGLEVSDGSRTLTLTPELPIIVSAGRVTMPTSLNGDGTYGVDISLPSTFSASNISAIATPIATNHGGLSSRYSSGSTLYFTTSYLNSSTSFYSRNDGTGVMTGWSAGNRTNGSRSTWNPLLSVYPIALWDKMGNTTFSSIRLFAGTIHLTQQYADISNVALSGTASGPADWDGTAVAYINDNNEGSRGCITTDYGSPRINTISFSTPCALTSIQLLYVTYTEGSGQYYQIDAYCNNQWITLSTVSVTGGLSGLTTNTFTCVCNGVTAIRVQAVANGGYLRLFIYEFRAYGSVMPTHKAVYTIGNSGVSAIDYQIAVKGYDI